MADIPNEQDGILIQGVSNNRIGGTNPTARNVISGNGYHGIRLQVNAFGSADNNVIQGNYIGVAIDGVTNLGNGDDGANANTSNNSIGGAAAGAGNLIAYNGDMGVHLDGGNNNRILCNSIYGNTNIGIDLDNDGVEGTNDGVTTNDPGDGDGGPNNLQNFPVLSAAVTNGSTITIIGAFNSTPNTTYRIEFFSNNPPGDITGYGEGQTYLGFANITTNGGGNANINTTLPAAVAVGQRVTATATNPNGNTSEFGGNVTAIP